MRIVSFESGLVTERRVMDDALRSINSMINMFSKVRSGDDKEIIKCKFEFHELYKN